jgi:hypothetical protein
MPLFPLENYYFPENYCGPLKALLINLKAGFPLSQVEIKRQLILPESGLAIEALAGYR